MVKYMDSGFNQWANMQNQKKPSKFSGFLWWLFLFFFAWWIMGLWFGPKNVQTNVPNEVVVEKSSVETRKISNDLVAFDVTGLRISNITLKQHWQDLNFLPSILIQLN